MATSTIRIGNSPVDVGLSTNFNFSSGRTYQVQNVGPFSVRVVISASESDASRGGIYVAPLEYFTVTPDGTEKVWVRSMASTDMTSELTSVLVE